MFLIGYRWNLRIYFVGEPSLFSEKIWPTNAFQLRLTSAVVELVLSTNVTNRPPQSYLLPPDNLHNNSTDEIRVMTSHTRACTQWPKRVINAIN